MWNTPSHSELGREKLQRRWYFVLRHGRVGHCQIFQVHCFLRCLQTQTWSRIWKPHRFIIDGAFAVFCLSNWWFESFRFASIKMGRLCWSVACIFPRNDRYCNYILALFACPDWSLIVWFYSLFRPRLTLRMTFVVPWTGIVALFLLFVFSVLAIIQVTYFISLCVKSPLWMIDLSLFLRVLYLIFLHDDLLLLSDL